MSKPGLLVLERAVKDVKWQVWQLFLQDWPNSRRALDGRANPEDRLSPVCGAEDRVAAFAAELSCCCSVALKTRARPT